MTKDDAISRLEHWRFGLRLDTVGIIDLIKNQEVMIYHAVKILAKENCPCVTPGEDGCDPDGCESHWLKELMRCKE